jgi:hypothetical protein
MAVQKNRLNILEKAKLVTWCMEHKAEIEEFGSNSKHIAELANKDLSFNVVHSSIEYCAKQLGFVKQVKEKPVKKEKNNILAEIQLIERTLAEVCFILNNLYNKLGEIPRSDLNILGTQMKMKGEGK